MFEWDVEQKNDPKGEKKVLNFKQTNKQTSKQQNPKHTS